MTDYSNWKVPELKAELKRRGIPQTGLRLKQQIIDRLEAEQSEEPAQPAAKAAEPEAEQQPEATEREEKPEEHAPKGPAVVNGDEAPSAAPETAQEAPAQDATAERAPEPPTTTEEPVEAAPTPSDQAPEKPPSPEPQQPEAPAAPAAVESEPAPVPVEPPPSSEGSVDDSRKRKRRSQSPPPSPRTAAQKKAKTQEGDPRVILSDDVAEKDKQPQDVEMHMEEQAKELQAEREGGERERPLSPRPEAVEAETVARETSHAPEERKEDEQAEKADEPQGTKRSAGDARFKELFSATNGEQGRPEQHAQIEPEPRAVEPALHPATTSLYIRDFMRPLQPTSLKTHLASLAAPPGESSESDVIINFFLDSIKTHCFVTFANISAAARVRSAMHDTIWPDERTRKPLWVDFVPEDKVKEWIGTEQSSNNSGRGAPRWEVTYEDNEDGVRAVLQEAASNQTQQGRAGGRDVGLNAPTGPRASRDLPPPPPPPGPARPEIPDRGFKALDDRFKSTTAKPKLYFLPVSRDISDKRLDRFDDLARTGPVDRRGGDEMRKYTFEDTDFFVDRGPEYGRRGPRGGRGGRGGFAGDFGGGSRDGNWRGRR